MDQVLDTAGMCEPLQPAQPQDEDLLERFDDAVKALTAMRSGSDIAEAMQFLHRSPPACPPCTLLSGVATSFVAPFLNAAFTALWTVGPDQHESFLQAAAPCAPVPSGPIGNHDLQLARLLAMDPRRHWDWYVKQVNRILEQLDPRSAGSVNDEDDSGIGPPEYADDHLPTSGSYLDVAPAPRPPASVPLRIRANSIDITALVTLLDGLASLRISRDARRTLWTQTCASLMQMDLQLPSTVHARLNPAVQEMLTLPLRPGSRTPRSMGEWLTVAEAAELTGKTPASIHNQKKQLREADPTSIRRTAGGRIQLRKDAVEKYLKSGSPDALVAPNTAKRRRQANRPD